MPLDNAGNTLSAARSLNITSSTQTFNDYVGSSDINDYYRFTLSARSSLNLAVNGLSADANVQLLDSIGNQIQSSTNAGTSAESIIRNLNTGTYYIRVYSPAGVETNYNLSLSAQTLADPGNTLATAEVQNSAFFSATQQVSASDRSRH